MVRKRREGPVVGIPGGREQHGVARAVKLAVDGVEAVDHELQLRGEAEVVERRREHDEVRVNQMRIENIAGCEL